MRKEWEGIEGGNDGGGERREKNRKYDSGRVDEEGRQMLWVGKAERRVG